MEPQMLMVYVSCIIGIIIIGKIFIVPIKWILRLVINSLLGSVLIYIINLAGGAFSLHIGINVFTSIIVGLLGIPGAILLAVFAG